MVVVLLNESVSVIFSFTDSFSVVALLSPVSVDFVLKSVFGAGDKLQSSGDTLSKYGYRFPVSGVILCSPDISDIIFSILTIEEIVESLYFYFNSTCLF